MRRKPCLRTLPNLRVGCRGRRGQELFVVRAARADGAGERTWDGRTGQVVRNVQLEQLMAELGVLMDPQVIRPGDGTARTVDGAVLGMDVLGLLERLNRDQPNGSRDDG